MKTGLVPHHNLRYTLIVVKVVVKHKITTGETLMMTRKDLVDNIITWDIITIF